MANTSLAQRASLIDGVGLSYEVVGLQTIGSSRIAWLRVEPAARIDGADASTALLVEETGRVPCLHVTNRGAAPVLVPCNRVLVGGKQTRVTDRSVVVPAGATTKLPVRCVEQDRWDDRPSSSRMTFAGALDSQMCASLAQERESRLTERGEYSTSQVSVWREVDEALREGDVRSVTRSYADMLNAKRSNVAPADTENLLVPSDANGVLVSAPTAAWVEVLPDAAQLARHAPSLQRDLRRRSSSARTVRCDPFAALAEARALPIDLPRGTIGEPYAVYGERVSGSMLLLDGQVAHLVASFRSR